MTRMRYREALARALREEMERDQRVLLMGEDIREPWGGTFKVTEGLSTTFGDDRVLNTPISENAIVGTALGCAMAGLRPIDGDDVQRFRAASARPDRQRRSPRSDT